MSEQLKQRILSELNSLALIDPHTHIDPHSPASKTLADIMGYHYYTELAHSAGLSREEIEEPGLAPKEKVGRLVTKLDDLENTIQLDWLMDICRSFFEFEDDRICSDNWEPLYDHAAAKMAEPDWEEQVLKKSGLEQVFLTNDFDDPLEGFDTDRYIPCLRTDDLVFGLSKPETRERLNKATNTDCGDAACLRLSIGKLFEHFVSRGARACAISLPPNFHPEPIEDTSIDPILQATHSGRALSDSESNTLSSHVFWTLAEMCAEYRLPFDLMIGVNRRVYEAGVFQGQDLFDQRTSLIQYRQLFNSFPQVTFPVSVLAQVSNQELVSYSWIFPNVVTNGHWWYSNIPAYIEIDCRSRLQAVPKSKQIGYYSDMYKLEFALPKFNMYRRILSGVLCDDFVIGRNWSEQKAIDLGKQILRGNVERIFPGR